MSSSFHPEEIDLAALASHLRGAVQPAAAVGAIVGRTQFRDAVQSHLDCSQTQAELLVDTMVGRGFLVTREVDGLVLWSVEAGD